MIGIIQDQVDHNSIVQKLCNRLLILQYNSSKCKDLYPSVLNNSWGFTYLSIQASPFIIEEIRVLNQQMTRSSWPQDGGSWQISGFHMRQRAVTFRISLFLDFLETSQNLISFIQLLFSLFQRVDPLEKSENPRNLPK